MKRYLLRIDGQLLVSASDTAPLPGEAEVAPLRLAEAEGFHFDWAGQDYCALNVTAAEVAPLLTADYHALPLRAAYTRLQRDDYDAAAKGFEWLHWAEQNRYCGRCGAPTQRGTELSRKCPACGLEIFPQVSPAIIVLVRRGRQALLVHARNFTRPVFGLVAGFVETGESLEQCVLREVREETSLIVDHLRYVGSQTWPYPASLMLGFTADYVSGEVQFADGELTQGGFFTPEQLPPLPDPPSIARQMIDEWLRNCAEP